MAIAQLWGLRLITLPHTLGGCLFVWMLFVHLAWMVLGRDVVGRVGLLHEREVKRGLEFVAHFHYDNGEQSCGGERTVPEEVYRRFKEAQSEMGPEGPVARGVSIRVRVLKMALCNEAEAILESESVWTGFWVHPFAASWFGAFASFLVYFAWVHPEKVRRLYKWGTATDGRIIEKNKSEGKSTDHILHFSFSVDGKTAVGEASVSEDQWNRAQVGENVTVLHYFGRARPYALCAVNGRRVGDYILG